MRMVNRMIDITAGDILLGGASVRERDPTALRREIGYVIQQIGLFPHQTIGENISTVPQLLGWDRSRVRRRVEELLELVGLEAALRDRRLALSRLGELELRAVNGSRPALRLPDAMTVRDALSAMLTADGAEALVVDGENRELGIVTVQTVADLLNRESE